MESVRRQGKPTTAAAALDRLAAGRSAPIDDATWRRWRRAIAGRADALLLETAPAGRAAFAAFPRATLRLPAGGVDWRLDNPDGLPLPAPQGERLEPLRRLAAATAATDGAAAGWYGLIGYDFAPRLERLPRRLPPTTAVPDVELRYFDTLLTRDADGLVRLESVDRFGEGTSPSRRRLLDLLDAAGPPQPVCGPLTTRPPVSDLTRTDYLRQVERVLEYVRAGDVFQANFTHRFSAPLTDAARAIDLHERCLASSPAPMMALVRGDGWDVVCDSPERFLAVDADGDVLAQPIKGTRGRATDPAEDRRRRADLLASPKDRAELAMIVDLLRNDLGRVCRFGTVRVRRHARLRSYSNVHHLVTDVVARLRTDCDAVALLEAAFPGGSITGAPKIRAMQVIDELEACRRGVYTGAIGYLRDDGAADFNIVIRTAVLEGGHVHYHVGGGIVADSVPADEHAETLAKGRGLRHALLGDARTSNHIP